jgi:hypothetical protein
MRHLANLDFDATLDRYSSSLRPPLGCHLRIIDVRRSRSAWCAIDPRLGASGLFHGRDPAFDRPSLHLDADHPSTGVKFGFVSRNGIFGVYSNHPRGRRGDWRGLDDDMVACPRADPFELFGSIHKKSAKMFSNAWLTLST